MPLRVAILACDETVGADVSDVLHETLEKAPVDDVDWKRLYARIVSGLGSARIVRPGQPHPPAH